MPHYALIADNNEGFVLVACPDRATAESVAAAATMSGSNTSGWPLPDKVHTDHEAVRRILRGGGGLEEIEDADLATAPRDSGTARKTTTPDSTNTDGPRIMTVIDLATNHLPAGQCNDLSTYDGVSAVDTGHGWLLHVPADLNEHRADFAELIPLNVWRLWEYAHRFGASYILLDADADRVDELPAWDW